MSPIFVPGDHHDRLYRQAVDEQGAQTNRLVCVLAECATDIVL
jgi:hypothetical protein